MLKNVKLIEKEMEKIKNVFKHITGKELQKVICHGLNEWNFKLEGIYQEFREDNTYIEARIREVYSHEKEKLFCLAEEDFYKIEQLIEYDGKKYLITIQIEKVVV